MDMVSIVYPSRCDVNVFSFKCQLGMCYGTLVVCDSEFTVRCAVVSLHNACMIGYKEYNINIIIIIMHVN